MTLLFTNETYNGGNFLSSNVGKWVDASIDFLHFVEYNSTTSQSSVIINEAGGVYWVELIDGSDWGDHGFADGNTVLFENRDINLATDIITVVVDYLDGEKMFVNINPSSMGLGQFPQFTTAGVLEKYFTIKQNSPAEKIEFDFNLTKTNSPSLASLIDGNINRFKAENINTLGLGGSMLMTQINNKSGGLFGDVTLTYVSGASGQRVYNISFSFYNWVLIQNGYNEPTWFNGIDTVGAINRIRVFAELNNPNTVMETVSQNTQGNCGGFDENFNTGINNYEVVDVNFRSVGGDVLNGIQYCNETDFEATINAPAGLLNVANSRFNIGMMWRTEDEDNFQNKLTNLGENLVLVAHDNDFSHATTPNPTVYNGYNNAEHGVRWSFKDIYFEIAGDVLTVRGTVLPTNGDNSYFSTLGEGESKHTLYISSYRADTPENQRLESSVILYNTDLICAPNLGVSLKLGNTILDHNNNTVTSTTTEDDVLIRTKLDLIEYTNYENLKVGLQIYNNVTEESFSLESFNFSFSNVTYINGVFQINEIIPRNFNLPPTTDRNIVQVVRNPAADNLNLYRLVIDYGFLNDWRYWMEKTNANLDFYDVSEPNNGLNKNWQKYTPVANWVFRHEILLSRTLDNGTSITDFHYETINIRDYEDEDVTETISFVDLANGSTPNTLMGNTEIEVTAELEWNDGYFNGLEFWAEATIEDFESGNRWVISSVLEQGNVSSNPLKSIIASDKLDLQIVNNNAVLKYKIDTNILTSNNVSITHRIYSDDTILAFKERVETDGGVFEAPDCLNNIINNLL